VFLLCRPLLDRLAKLITGDDCCADNGRDRTDGLHPSSQSEASRSKRVGGRYQADQRYDYRIANQKPIHKTSPVFRAILA
jgi:hypothetical protein